MELRRTQANFGFNLQNRLLGAQFRIWKIDLKQILALAVTYAKAFEQRKRFKI